MSYDGYRQEIRRGWRYAINWPPHEIESEISFYIHMVEPSSVIGLITTLLEEIRNLEQRLESDRSITSETTSGLG